MTIQAIPFIYNGVVQPYLMQQGANIVPNPMNLTPLGTPTNQPGARSERATPTFETPTIGDLAGRRPLGRRRNRGIHAAGCGEHPPDRPDEIGIRVVNVGSDKGLVKKDFDAGFYRNLWLLKVGIRSRARSSGSPSRIASTGAAPTTSPPSRRKARKGIGSPWRRPSSSGSPTARGTLFTKIPAGVTRSAGRARHRRRRDPRRVRDTRPRGHLRPRKEARRLQEARGDARRQAPRAAQPRAGRCGDHGSDLRSQV